jgi:hypothetical protein
MIHAKLTLLVIALTATTTVATADPTPSPEIYYAEGQAAYDRADYVTAIMKWEVSYDLSGESGLLFNLAQARRLSGDCRGALKTYKRFVAANRTADEQRSLAEDLVRELESKCGGPPPPPPFIAAPQTAAPGQISADRLQYRGHSSRGLRIVGLATGGAGIAAIAGGLALDYHGSVLGDQITKACAVSCSWSAQSSTYAAGRRDAAIGYALDAVGAAAIVGGAVMYYLGVKQDVIGISRPSEGGAVVSWGGSW